MPNTTDNQGNVVPEQTGPKLLVRQVRNALASFYDLPYLQSHPLARLLPRPSRSGPTSLGQMLQHQLLDGIKRLQPVLDGAARLPCSIKDSRPLTSSGDAIMNL